MFTPIAIMCSDFEDGLDWFSTWTDFSDEDGDCPMLTAETDGVIPQVQQCPALRLQQPAPRMRMPLMPSVQPRPLIPVQFAFPIQQQFDP
jgi:hypothetical protein